MTGQAWLDREWSSQPLTAGQEGWDWFALHLDDGEKLMAYRLRDSDGGAFLAATWIAADGTPHPIARDAITATPTAWTEVAGRSLPSGWRLAIPPAPSRWTSRRSIRKAGWARPTPTGKDRSASPAATPAAATWR